MNNERLKLSDFSTAENNQHQRLCAFKKTHAQNPFRPKRNVKSFHAIPTDKKSSPKSSLLSHYRLADSIMDTFGSRGWELHYVLTYTNVTNGYRDAVAEIEAGNWKTHSSTYAVNDKSK